MSFCATFLTKKLHIQIIFTHLTQEKSIFPGEDIIYINCNILRSRKVMDGYEFLLGLDRPTWLIAATVNE